MPKEKQKNREAEKQLNLGFIGDSDISTVSKCI